VNRLSCRSIKLVMTPKKAAMGIFSKAVNAVKDFLKTWRICSFFRGSVRTSSGV